MRIGTNSLILIWFVKVHAFVYINKQKLWFYEAFKYQSTQNHSILLVILILSNLDRFLFSRSTMMVIDYNSQYARSSFESDTLSGSMSSRQTRVRTIRLVRPTHGTLPPPGFIFRHGPSLGFSVRGGREHGTGFFVSLVEPGSEAHRQGLKVWRWKHVRKGSVILCYQKRSVIYHIDKDGSLNFWNYLQNCI